MKRLIVVIVTIVLVGCSSATSSQTVQPMVVQTEVKTPASNVSNKDTPFPIDTIAPTETMQPTATATPTPTPLIGKLFFDMNGSGLQDQAIFIYDSSRITDERQPLQPDLLKVIADYVNTHPELKEGDQITIDEPILSGFIVCYHSECSTTDGNGNFTISDIGTNPYPKLNITDPNDNTPALTMRYINQWNKAVVIPAHSMKGIDIPEQHLNDTSISTIGEGIIAKSGQENQIGLMQGFLTSPFQANLIKTPILWTYTDLNLELGELKDWKGNQTPVWIGDQQIWNDITPGVYDQHQGTDWVMPISTSILAMGNGKIFNSEGGYPNDYARYVREIIDIPGDSSIYLITFGHNSINLVDVGDTIHRGQIIALSGNDAGLTTTNPHVHVSVWQVPRDIWYRYSNLPELGDFLFGRGIFEGNGRAVDYTNGSKVALDFCPFLNQLFIMGSIISFP